MLRWFETRIDPFPSTEPNRPPSRFVAFCWHFSRQAWPLLTVMSLSSAAISAFEVFLFHFMGQLVDRLAEADRATFWAEEGWSLVMMAAGLLLVLPTMVVVNSVSIHQGLLANYPMVFRWQAHRFLLTQSWAFYQDDFAGRIGTKVMQTALAMREAVMKVLDIFVYVGVYFIGMLVLAGTSDFRLMVPLLIWLGVYGGLLRYFLPRLRHWSMRQADARSTMTGRVVDSYTNIQTVKLFAHTQRELLYVHDAMSGFLDTVYGQMRLATGLHVLVYINNTLLFFSVTAVSIWLWLQNGIALGAVAVTIALVLRLHGISQWIMWEVATLFENMGTVQDGIDLLSKPRTVMDKPDAVPLRVERGEIVFDHVRFHYGKGSGVIEDLSLTIRPGEKVGLVGRSGAGKSTLVTLLLRLYDLEGGRINIDGQDIAQVTQESLRRQIGMVTQDTSLLHRSVRENILYGRPEADEAAMREAARQAQADSFIAGLIDPAGRTGYDAHVGERGVRLSGGQRQRIAVTRVLLKNAPILLLDEATSALDSEVEAAIQENLQRLMQDKTVIAIAHRLSTIAAMDRLVVMDQGDVIEQGTHDSLLQAGGVYADLWARQSGGFIAGGFMDRS